MKKRAFSLVEILCVTVILGVLSAILFPVFAQAKLGAKAGAAKPFEFQQIRQKKKKKKKKKWGKKGWLV